MMATGNKKDENSDPSPKKITVWSRNEQKVRIVNDEDNSLINVRMTGFSAQGGRTYMEDKLVLAYHPKEEGSSDSMYTFAGVFDGHGGAQAADYTRNKLMAAITGNSGFWSKNDGEILKSIKKGFLTIHNEMSKEQDTWPRTANNYPCTAGTTASILFIRNGKIYTGHVGDSRIVVGDSQASSLTNATPWASRDITEDHKPESVKERERIEKSGGKVMVRNGISRVAWKRPKPNHSGPIRRSTNVEEIPFLSVARSLGDFWSYNVETNMFAVSPDPDVNVITLDPKINRCLVLASDGLWGVMTSEESVRLVQKFELERNEVQCANTNDNNNHGIQNLKNSKFNPSTRLGQIALARWKKRHPKGDNVSVITIMIEHPTVVNQLVNSTGNVEMVNDREEILVECNDGNDEDIDICSVEVSSSDGELNANDRPLSLAPEKVAKSNIEGTPKGKSSTLQSRVISSSSQNMLNGDQSVVIPNMADNIKLRKRKLSTQFSSAHKWSTSDQSTSSEVHELEYQRPPKAMKLNDADIMTFSLSEERDAKVVKSNVGSPSSSKIKIMETLVQSQTPKLRSDQSRQSNKEQLKKISKTGTKLNYTKRFHDIPNSVRSNVITPILPPESVRILPNRVAKEHSLSEKETPVNQSKPRFKQRRQSSGSGGIKSRISLYPKEFKSERKRRHTIAAKTTTKFLCSPAATSMMTRSRARKSRI